MTTSILFGVPFNALANTIYALPGLPSQVSFKSVSAVDLLTSTDGTNFTIVSSALANELKTVKTTAKFFKVSVVTTVTAIRDNCP